MFKINKEILTLPISFIPSKGNVDRAIIEKFTGLVYKYGIVTKIDTDNMEYSHQFNTSLSGNMMLTVSVTFEYFYSSPNFIIPNCLITKHEKDSNTGSWMIHLTTTMKNENLESFSGTKFIRIFITSDNKTSDEILALGALKAGDIINVNTLTCHTITGKNYLFIVGSIAKVIVPIKFKYSSSMNSVLSKLEFITNTDIKDQSYMFEIPKKAVIECKSLEDGVDYLFTPIGFMEAKDNDDSIDFIKEPSTKNYVDADSLVKVIIGYDTLALYLENKLQNWKLVYINNKQVLGDTSFVTTLYG